MAATPTARSPDRPFCCAAGGSSGGVGAVGSVGGFASAGTRCWATAPARSPRPSNPLGIDQADRHHARGVAGHEDRKARLAAHLGVADLIVHPGGSLGGRGEENDKGSRLGDGLLDGGGPAGRARRQPFVDPDGEAGGVQGVVYGVHGHAVAAAVAKKNSDRGRTACPWG